MEISSLPEREFKVMVRKAFIKLGRRWTNTVRRSTKRQEGNRKNPSELKRTVTNMKNALEEINSRGDDVKSRPAGHRAVKSPNKTAKRNRRR